MDHYFFMLATPLLLALSLTPVMRRVAFTVGAVDLPSKRKIHKGKKPLLGGLSLYLAIAISLIIFYVLNGDFFVLLVSMSMIVLLGIVDDVWGIRPYPKLAGQFAAAFLLIGSKMSYFEKILAYLDDFLGLRIISILLVVIWIVAITNAFNLIDGLDGLAAGSALIIAALIVLLSIFIGNSGGIGLAVILVGASLGFFPFNFPPARIFLGDAGSMLLGFSLSVVLLINLSNYSISFISVLGAVLLFVYPVVDTSYAIWRRMRNGQHIFKADKDHIHHQMLKDGFSVRSVDTIIYLCSLLIGACGIIAMMYPAFWGYALLGVGLMTVVLLLFSTRSFKQLWGKVSNEPTGFQVKQQERDISP